MAIKGKGRTTRRRAVAGAPRPVYVTPKKPFFARRSTKAGAILVAVGLIAGFAIAGYVKNRNQHRFDAEKAIVQTFGQEIDGSLQQVAQPFQTTVLPLPDLGAQLSGLKEGKSKPDQVIPIVVNDAIAAAHASNSILGLPVTKMITNHPALLSMLDVQDYLGRSLQIYEQVAGLIGQAAKASGAERTVLLARAQGLITPAAELFNRGYGELSNLRNTYGLLQPIPNNGPVPPNISPLPLTSNPATSTSPSASPKASSSSGSSKKKK